jgi:chromosome segregation ATPase
MPTLWLSLVAVIGCIGAVVYQKRKPGEKEPAVTRKAKASTMKPIPAVSTGQVKSVEPRTIAATSQRVTGESIREFADSYEDKKRLNAEMRSLDTRAQKGKIPRRQYKVQRRAIEVRLETLSRNTSRMKEALRSQGSAYSDLIKQLDSAEEDLAEAEDNIKSLEDQQSRGEISIEAYKRTIEGYQKRRDKAESALNGILLRLREKAR